ncbi:MAG: restriction endonuclease subunit S, partial [Mariprofundaceae bacterium]|nr:restriction endonuclease subunit S [Mariprofundaceae bacterium]
TLIEKQQRLIKLLKEKRQAVISHAVTKGLNPNAPMRDSGVEWLGEVPEGWEVSQIKHIAELTPRKSEVEKEKHQSCNFVPMKKLKTDSLILDETRLISDVYDGYTYFKNEDILMAKVTPCFENKNIAIARNLVNSIGFGSSEIYVLRAKKEVINEFLYYRLQEDEFMAIATAAMSGAGGLKRVPSDVVNNFTLAIPCIEEQKAIVTFIQGYLVKFDDLIFKAESAISLLKERRTALISAAVTGKIDVRTWKAPVENTTSTAFREMAQDN